MYVRSVSYYEDDSADRSYSAQLNQQNSPLLKAPAEIRNRIYELVLDVRSDRVFRPPLDKANYHCIDYNRKDNERDDCDRCYYTHHHSEYLEWNHLDFSRTCRQIFAETAGNYFESKILPFATHVVAFSSQEANPAEVIARLNILQRAVIKRLFLFDSQAAWTRKTLFVELPNLKHIMAPGHGRHQLPPRHVCVLKCFASGSKVSFKEGKKPKHVLYLE
jgi:hypothetical protein